MGFIARIAIDNNCSRLDWTADADNPSATSFYEKISAPKLTDKIYYRAEKNYLQTLAEEG